MKQTDVSMSEQLDATLSLRRTQNYARLRQAAEGRLRWAEAVGLVSALVLVIVGLAQFERVLGADDFMRSGIVFVVLGLALLISFQWSSSQRQRSALLALIERLEEEHS